MWLTILKELGLTRGQFKKLSWIDQRMYTEALQDDIYERNVGKWKEGGKKGPKPKPPQDYELRQANDGINQVKRDNLNRPIAPDIGDMLK